MAPPRNPPGITIPPPRKKERAKGTPFEQYVRRNPLLKPWAPLVQKWAAQYGIDAIYLGSLLLFESLREAKRRGVDPRTVMSPTGGGFGIAQINPKVWFDKAGAGPEGATVTREWAANANNAIHFAAWYLKKGLVKHGNYDLAYRRGYNPGYKGAGPFAEGPNNIPRGYVARSAKLTPGEQARVGEEQTQARQVAARPRIAKEEFKQFWNSLNDIYQAYAGRNANHKEALSIYKSGISEYGLIQGLTKRKSFFGSPVWESKSRDYISIARDLGMPVDKKLVAKAIANNWDGAAFAERLRELPGYLNSSEFKNQEASFTNIYRSIYGEPDENMKLTMKELTLGRWKPDQVAAYLRNLPEYRRSAEYQTKIYELQAALGYLPTQASQAPLVYEPLGERPPDSQRIPGSPNY